MAYSAPTKPDFSGQAISALDRYGNRSGSEGASGASQPKEMSGGNMGTATIIAGIIAALTSATVGGIGLAQNKRMAGEAKAQSAQEYADQLRFSNEELSMQKQQIKENADNQKIALAFGIQSKRDRDIKDFTNTLQGLVDQNPSLVGKLQSLWG